MNRRNIVLTGTGRPGTTLVCHLLNRLPDTVALAGVEAMLEKVT